MEKEQQWLLYQEKIGEGEKDLLEIKEANEILQNKISLLENELQQNKDAGEALQTPAPQLKEEERKRRIQEGLYKQLREQFIEKSSLLDKTRQELFLAHEESLRQQRDFFEEKINWESQETLHLYTLVDKTVEEGEKREGELKNEIALLENLVATLCQV